jgi:hypothetical protein
MKAIKSPETIAATNGVAAFGGKSTIGADAIRGNDESKFRACPC